MRAPTLRPLLARGESTLGIWITLESPAVTEIAAVMGLDWVVIDAEHGALDFQEVAAHLRVLRRTRTTALVRIPSVERGYIKRVLDLGAEGILVPQVQTADEVAEAVRYAKYPLQGLRGIGADRATLWGMAIKSYTRDANRQTLVIPMIEHVRAGENFKEIISVKGVDAVFFGTVDYAASAGFLGQFNPPEIEEQLQRLHRIAKGKKMPTGLLALDPAQVRNRQRQGFSMLGIGIDSQLIIQSLGGMLAASGRKPKPRTWHA